MMMAKLRRFDWSDAVRNGSLAAAIWFVLLVVDSVFHAFKIPATPIDGAFTLANGALVANLGIVVGKRNTERDRQIERVEQAGAERGTQLDRIEREGYDQHQRIERIEGGTTHEATSDG